MQKGTPSRRCRARRKSGKPCGNPPMAGGFVCRMHGGSAPQVKRAAAQRLADLIDPDRVLRETAALAYIDLRQLFDAQGKLLPIHELPDNVAAALASVEVVRQNITAGDGSQEWVHKVRLWDKTKALDMLMRHLALYKDQLRLGVTPEAEQLLARLAAGRARVAKERRA
jgi:hypothetical protein